jgi:hypothetical protein
MRTPAHRTARRLGVVVRKGWRHIELQASLAGEELDGLGALLQKSIHARCVEMRGGFVLQVGARRSPGGSVMPCSVARWVPGTQSQPPERAVVPPKSASFSTTSTFRPSDAAVTAALMPEAPVPTTNTSQSPSHLVSSMGVFRVPLPCCRSV